MWVYRPAKTLEEIEFEQSEGVSRQIESAYPHLIRRRRGTDSIIHTMLHRIFRSNKGKCKRRPRPRHKRRGDYSQREVKSMGDNLKQLREHLGIKQCAVAKQARMDAGKLSKIERGWITPKPSEVARIKTAIAKLAERGKWS